MTMTAERLREMCSTPFGIGDRITHGLQGLALDLFAVLNAFRHRRSDHGSAARCSGIR